MDEGPTAVPPAALGAALADRLTPTRRAWHRVAEHVVAKARFVDDGEIRLTAWPGGFATPVLGDGRQVGVSGTELVVVGPAEGERRTAPLRSVGGAAAFVGVGPGFPTTLYAPATPLEPDAALVVDADAAEVLGWWYGLTAGVLEQARAELAPEAVPSPLVLWPEHFDQAYATGDAVEARRANYGASPGDDGHPEPYAYVGPWATPPPGPFWSAPHFPGAVLGLGEVARAADPAAAVLAFLRRGRDLLAT